MLKPYKRLYCDGYANYTRPIVPTGRYKFRTISHENVKIEVMYVEIKGGFMNWFTEWIHEVDIIFKDIDILVKDIPTISEEIFVCSKEN